MIGERIRRLRKRLGLTQKEFAGRVAGKVDYTYIGKMEREEQYPSLKMLERIGKAFSVPLSYFFEDDSLLKSLNLLPGEVKDLLRDRKRQDLLKISQGLNPRDLGLVTQIINILTQKKPLEGLRLAEPGLDYLSMKEKKKKDLISKIEPVLRSSPRVLSAEEDWLRQALKIALEVLKRSPG
ncbi:helix-turn-helix transcriptional regulator [Candidatus Aerophobetes bacterium]|nr:helix-turn-helix transcriptional regulator [Candidatus Aerophobetes bacterium]